MPLKHRVYITIGLVLAVLLVAGCSSQTAEPAASENSEADAQPEAVVEEVAESEDSAANEPEEDAAPEEPSLPALPAERQAVEIITIDGRTLEGFYYPAAINPAPIVVLMHWAGGDMEDWSEIAPWLQNRADELALNSSGQIALASYANRQVGGPWLDPTWFPPMPAAISFGVLLFNFGDYGNSEPGAIPEGWAFDALAAVIKASELEGVDPHRIATLGASIGADGAVDGCYMFNADYADSVAHCIGAFSLSPGNYLTDEFTYAEAVTTLDLDGHPVWCLNAIGDSPSNETCASAQGELYQMITYPEGYHGMFLVQPEYLPSDPPLGVDTMVTIQDFLEEVFGVEIN